MKNNNSGIKNLREKVAKLELELKRVESERKVILRRLRSLHKQLLSVPDEPDEDTIFDTTFLN